MIRIYTDGSSRGNPGPGGWGAIVFFGDEFVVELGGREAHTTNNRMELTAAVYALRFVESHEKKREDQGNFTRSNDLKSYPIDLRTDSQYLINGITKWIWGWEKNGWKTAAKEKVLNQDLWMELFSLTQQFKVNWNYVAGHSGVIANERCDEIATAFADGIKVPLYSGELSKYALANIAGGENSRGQEKDYKKSDREKNRKYSYISMVDGKIMVHDNWDECEKRVKGVSGAKYKKISSETEKARVMEEFTAYLRAHLQSKRKI
ncbi:MAG: ribonuclease HI [Candidatus Taylorbacteria bacterium RIFCSPLOWO2_12_FULL_43_20]|uniref:Ribonuclease H n=1 Tax=Candidatus Taylorbacteria bacterium RIFCSPLOWO2_12_FULL_43_20 TaxID=1802332 RepID=A0A1G2NZP8_9BACT|nr:MAG: ribonuclease HI [Candidatus Taylorbacteria bacterium RIFCSPHIGHO2_01_FULL_43_120]OHA23659.1 MAG: ribonuclease HI [Candidatus Taylorbacteria bacterium RIFCSPHIGHO2_02_FULL_43_55]OHA28134.1 MAG: ribonuclease HI [Candidatus Taylorbacteria bacterium RIFCSPHIGHO2_12_FULL_42_34]OHA32347.1 MAG: ribonuclease HI [Candidatus Taylorbacteria bacterium RIFCSPLOWO2_01_FULL_43_83]OHA37684.1 MAG: ribonuclease HI [Candidatus Taylorbacteria bacterium RIFCSPLOWO2_02_FULL_43_22b]OHA41575.1 MAG: ribonuclea